MVRLGERWIAVACGGVCVAEWQVNCKAEEYLVVDIDMLAHRLVRVEGHDLSLDNCSCSLSGSFKEVSVDFSDSSVSLHSLHVILTGKVLNYLELFVPVVHLFKIYTVKWYDCLS